MPHPAIVNLTPFHVTPLFLADADMRSLLVPLVRAVFAIRPDGSLVLHEQQPEPKLAGEFYGKPDSSSYRFEPECAFFKPATDVVLIGDACPPGPGTTEVQVGVRVGPLNKVVRVTGDRTLSRSLGSWRMSPAKAFERIPLVYERAFGGWDRHHADPTQHRCEPRNPVGTGFRCHGSADDIVVPNLEDPGSRYTQPGDRPAPAGFGFTSPAWQPRASFAGTYDEAWDAQRKPLLPKDFDLRFMNGASPGLIAQVHLTGREDVLVANASVRGQLAFRLPGVAAPVCEAELRGRRHHRIETRLDTVIIDSNAHLVHLLWRGQLPLPGGPHALVALRAACASHPAGTATAAAVTG